MNKQFKNKDLKKIITDLYNDNNITIDENLKIQLQKSSKTQYYKLEKYYNEIKLKITDLLLSKISSRKLSNEIIYTPIIINEKKEIETQTEYIEENDKNIIIIELKTENFIQKQKLKNYKYKILCYKKELKKLNNKKINLEINSLISSDDEQKEHRKIKYNQLLELSSVNIIHELNKLSRHELKSLYNKYFSNKLSRKIN